MKKKYYLEHLGCANCAAKMEAKINQLPEVESAVISYPTKQLHLTAEHPDQLLDKIQEICASIEHQVVVTEKKKHSSHVHKHEHHHDHEHCGCGCGHDHEHHHEHHHHEHEHSEGATKVKYYLHHLGCANCAAKMEAKINALDGVESAAISFPTKQLHLTAKHPEHLLDQIQEICASIEHEVIVSTEKPDGHSTSHAHTHTHSHDHESHEETVEKESLFAKHQSLIFGIVLAIAAFSIHALIKNENIVLIAFLIAYCYLAKGIIHSALKNIQSGHLFDENFLMTLATIGAFFIGEYPEALGVILFYRIGEAFEDHAVEKSRASIMATVNLRPETVIKVHGNHTHEIPAEDAQVGDILLIRPGDRIPLDGMIIEGNSQIDTSALTGEPVPVSVSEGSEVLSGCLNTSGVLKLKVQNELEESAVTRIMESMEDAAASKPKLDRFITRFAKIYTPIVVTIAILTAVIPSIITGNWSHWIYTACSFLVISCPCALVLSVPLAFFSGIGLGSQKGILFKGGASLEALHAVKAVIMDKTGTITEGNFVVQKLLPAALNEDKLLAYAAACEQDSTHPIAKSILEAAKAKKVTLPSISDIQEISGHGIEAVIDGKEVLCGNQKLMELHQIALPKDSTDYGTEVLLAIDHAFAGRILISDTLKEDSASSISALNAAGLKTIMLTGDSEESAKNIAEKTNVQQYFAKLLPGDKLDMLQKLRKSFGAVMFVGDGINDAPVLAGADCGAAMGSGADAAIEAADVVFMTSRLSAIPEAIKIAHTTNAIAVQNIVFALAIKIAVIILGLFGIASMWMAVFADTGVAVICIFNSIRILKK